MNGKTINLDGFDSFNAEDGSYSTRCVCGAVNTLTVERIDAPTIKMKCNGCYLQYEVRASNMNIGTAYYYRQQYENAIRHFLHYLEEDPTDCERRRDVEHNVFECYSTLYHRYNTKEEREACVQAFHACFPQSKYSFDSSASPSSITPESFFHYLDGQMAQLRTLCSSIQTERNHI